MNNGIYEARPVEILLVEDNPGDIRLTEEALKEGHLTNNLRVVMDGAEALDFLHKKGKFTEAPTPDLILLDLNLPKKDGREVLKEIKAEKRLKSIPVIVLTTSKSEDDICRMYELQANCYISKPVDLTKFFDVIRSIEDFWLTIVRLPTRR